MLHNTTSFPRVHLGFLPTPLILLKNLTTYLKGPTIYMKRDDCTGLAMGGNKVRKLEFLIGDALKKGCDTVITCGGVQSNHVRQTAAAAAAQGLACLLVLSESQYRQDSLYRENGNFLLDHLLGAELHIVPPNVSVVEEMQRVSQMLTHKKPYIIPMGGSNAIGALGYVTATEELYQQCQAQHIKPSHLIIAAGSGGTQAGLVVGKHLLNWDINIMGISVGVNNPPVNQRTQIAIDATCQLLKINKTLPFAIDENYVGEHYGEPTLDSLNAIQLLAQTEGILLDPVYTSKAMAGLIDAVKKGCFTSRDTVIFLHTGGATALHAYAADFTLT